MDIKPHQIKVRDLFAGYKDSQEEGVVAYGGKLDVRPKYQREFVYKDKQRNAVIETLLQGFPLNVMYWVVKDDGTYEVLDGQQRTISICQYLEGDFSITDQDGTIRYFHNWEDDVKDLILDYELTVYFCEGSDTEKLAWFRTINIAGEKLTDQELLNAVYAGPWLTNAKKYFSKTGCVAAKIGDKLVSGSPIRQDLLEKALLWIGMAKNCDIKTYMAKHQNDLEATELWDYYHKVIDWVNATFTHYRKEMKGLDWGSLYHDFHDQHFDTIKLEEEVDRLMKDDDVTNKKGIYSYVLTRQERFLNIRAFDSKTKRTVYEKQQGRCPICGMTFKIEEMEADHILPWSKGGHTDLDNCQMLCRNCNRGKGNS